jgi:hypothetical protein
MLWYEEDKCYRAEILLYMLSSVTACLNPYLAYCMPQHAHLLILDYASLLLASVRPGVTYCLVQPSYAANDGRIWTG